MTAWTILTIILVVAVAALVWIFWYLSRKVFGVAVAAHVTKAAVFEKNAEGRDYDNLPDSIKNNLWLAEQPFEERHLAAADGTPLFARILYPHGEERGDKWAIAAHGFTGSGLKMGSVARHYHDLGYNTLLPDLRGCGQSGSDYYGMGWMDAQDMLLWMDMIVQMQPDARIVMCGGSMGGACTMMTTGLDLPKNVKCAIEDCGYASVWDEFTYQLKKVFGLPKFPFMYIVNSMCKRKAGYSFKDASSLKMLRKSKTPTLFIHGTKDEFVPYAMLEQNYEAAACPKVKLPIEGAGHGVSFDVNPGLYWGTVDKFLHEYIGE